jgi:hypothetical protein
MIHWDQTFQAADLKTCCKIVDAIIPSPTSANCGLIKLTTGPAYALHQILRSQ